MQPSSVRQKVCLVFFVASMVAGAIFSYVWAYYLAPPDSKFPTHWAVYKLSFSIAAVIASISTMLFALPLCFVRQLSGTSVSIRDYWLTFVMGVSVHMAIFAAPIFRRNTIRYCCSCLLSQSWAV